MKAGLFTAENLEPGRWEVEIPIKGVLKWVDFFDAEAGKVKEKIFELPGGMIYAFVLDKKNNPVAKAKVSAKGAQTNLEEQFFLESSLNVVPELD